MNTAPEAAPRYFLRKSRDCSLALLIVSLALGAVAEPRVDSRFTGESGRHARLYERTAELTAGNFQTAWSRNTVTQSLPTGSGVQALYSSADWVYIHTSGTGGHPMGPRYLNAAKTTLFPNLPGNTATTCGVSRAPGVPGAKTLTDRRFPQTSTLAFSSP